MAHRSFPKDILCMFCNEVPCACGVKRAITKRVNLDLINGPAGPEEEPKPRRRRKVTPVQAEEQPPVVEETGDIAQQRKRNIFAAKQQPMNLSIRGGISQIKKEETEESRLASEQEAFTASQPTVPDVSLSDALLNLFRSGMVDWRDIEPHKDELDMPESYVYRLVWQVGMQQMGR